MKARLDGLASLGIPTEFHVYEGLPHGFGLGTGTIAEGWIDDAVKFWEKQMKDNGTTGMTPMLYGKLSHNAKYYRQQENDKK